MENTKRPQIGEWSNVLVNHMYAMKTYEKRISYSTNTKFCLIDPEEWPCSVKRETCQTT